MYVYVLRSKRDGKRYVGLAADVQKRLVEHNRGVTRSTKGRGPFILVYAEYLATLPEARKREKYLKTAAGRRFLHKADLE